MSVWLYRKKDNCFEIVNKISTHTSDKFSKLQLKQHLMDHGGKRPYPCPECTFTCKTKQQLNEHRRKHSVSWKQAAQICLQTSFTGRKGVLMFTMRNKVHIQERFDQAHKTQPVSKENCSSRRGTNSKEKDQVDRPNTEAKL